MTITTTATTNQLQSLLAQLKAEQHSLIDAAAIQGGSLHKSHLHTISELENVIAAIMELMDERHG